jgi:hypothetical protein
MTTQHRNLKNISGGSQNDALPMYIHLKIPKSRETVSLSREGKESKFNQWPDLVNFY